MADRCPQSPHERIQNQSSNPVPLSEFYASVLQSQHNRPPLVFLIRHEEVPASSTESYPAQSKQDSASAESSRGSPLRVTCTPGSSKVPFPTNYSKKVANEEHLEEEDCSLVGTKHPTEEEVYSVEAKNTSPNCASSTHNMADADPRNSPVKVRCSVREASEEKSTTQNSVTTFSPRKLVYHHQVQENDLKRNSSTHDNIKFSNYSVVDGASQDHFMFDDMEANKYYSYFDALWGSPSHRESTCKETTLGYSAPLSTLRGNLPERCSVDCLNSSGNSCEKNQSSIESEDLNATRQIGNSHLSKSKFDQSNSGKRVSRQPAACSLQHCSNNSFGASNKESSEARPLTTVIRFSKDKETYYVDNRCTNNTRKCQSPSLDQDGFNVTCKLASETLVPRHGNNGKFISDCETSSQSLNLRNVQGTSTPLESNKQHNSLAKQIKKNIFPKRGRREASVPAAGHFKNSKVGSGHSSASSSSNPVRKSVDLLLQPDKPSLPSHVPTRSNKHKIKHSSPPYQGPKEHFPNKLVSTLALTDNSAESDDGEFDPSFKIEVEPESGLFLCRFCSFKAITEFIIKEHSYLHNGSLVPIRRKKPEILSKLSIGGQENEALRNSSEVLTSPATTKMINPEVPEVAVQTVGISDKFIIHPTTTFSQDQSSIVEPKVHSFRGNSNEITKNKCDDFKISCSPQTNDVKSKIQSKVSMNAVGIGVKDSLAAHAGGAVEVLDETTSVAKIPKTSFGGYRCRFCDFTTRKVHSMASHMKVCRSRTASQIPSTGPDTTISATEVHINDIKTGVEKHIVRGTCFQQSNYSEDDSRKSMDSTNRIVEVPAGSSAATAPPVKSIANFNEEEKGNTVKVPQVLKRVPYRKLAKPFGCPLCTFSATKMTVIRRHMAKHRH